MCDILRDLVSFAQFKKLEKHPWSVYTKRNNFTKSSRPPWVLFTF